MPMKACQQADMASRSSEGCAPRLAGRAIMDIGAPLSPATAWPGPFRAGLDGPDSQVFHIVALGQSVQPSLREACSHASPLAAATLVFRSPRRAERFKHGDEYR